MRNRAFLVGKAIPLCREVSTCTRRQAASRKGQRGFSPAVLFAIVMKTIAVAIALAAGLVAATPGVARSRPASQPIVGQEAIIPFVNFRGIRSFHADDYDLVYLQDYRRRWYRAELIGNCHGLPWAMRIAVDTRGSSNFDRGSLLLVGDERCMISSLTYSDPPPRRASRRGKPAAN